MAETFTGLSRVAHAHAQNRITPLFTLKNIGEVADVPQTTWLKYDEAFFYLNNDRRKLQNLAVFVLLTGLKVAPSFQVSCSSFIHALSSCEVALFVPSVVLTSIL